MTASQWQERRRHRRQLRHGTRYRAGIRREGANVSSATSRRTGYPASLYRQTDVSQPQQVRALIELAVSAIGRLDILVNNAGINGALVPLAEQSEAGIDAVLGVNLKGVIYGMKYGLIEMRRQRAGVIVNIASVQGIRPIYAGASIYAASKAAVVSLTRSAAHEYGQYGIRVVAVAPGPIDTPMLRAADPQGSDRRCRALASHRYTRGHRERRALACERRGVLRFGRRC